KYYTLEEYRTLIEPEQTDKDGNVVYLYTTDPTAQYKYIDNATSRGYSVLVMDGQLDSHFVGMLEQELKQSRFVRVDSDIVENLIPKSDRKQADLTATERNILTTMFQYQLPKEKDANFLVTFEALGENSDPVEITQNEYMRRMKEMAALQPGMSFYGELPDSYNVIVNTENKLVKNIIADADKALASEIEPLEKSVDDLNAKITSARGEIKDGKATDEQQAEISKLEADVKTSRDKQAELIGAYGANVPVVKQLIDLALLGNGLLKGKELTEFIRRSYSLL
ncbi:MAG: phage scaffolding protein, partial [Muribaculaceae bacterium]|nr:phage scaffolding protein [Muribaculaceae bacterium]